MTSEGLSGVSPELGDAIIHATEILNENSLDIEKTEKEFLGSKFSHLWGEVKKFLIPVKDDGGATITDSSTSIEQPLPWYQEPKLEHESYWHSYVNLLVRKGWESAINDIRTSTRDLIDRIPDPHGEPLDVSGLVVGRVQSGKTANFTGLIARAVDSGYNLIIVMSGTLNNLRDQTQLRLLRELTGHESHPLGYNVEMPNEPDKQIRLLTNIGDNDDFKGADENFLNGDRPMLAVVKKNVVVLEKLYKWLKSTTTVQRSNLKLLMIDDESDYGSVNNNRKRAATESIRPVEEEIEPETKSDLEASKTNSYVRGILNMFPTRAYIGYTATPYANVAIDPNDDNASFDFEDGRGLVSLEKTLYPRNFIRLLSKVPGYVGLGEIFPSTARLPHVSQVSMAEARRLRNDNYERLPVKLTRALVDYIVTGAIKKHHYGEDVWPRKHHAMMVHTTHSVKKMRPLAKKIDEQIKVWKITIHDIFDPDYDELVELFKESWEDFSNDDFDIEKITDFMPEIQLTRLVNSEKDEGVIDDDLNPDLDFDSTIVKGIIVGGNLLSRGLTVEGLTISYFIRDGSTYASMIQMCRWNGIRSDFEKNLIRVYLTEWMIEDYQFMNLVEKDLREEIRHYWKVGLNPCDFAVRILMHKVDLEHRKLGRKKLTPDAHSKMTALAKCDRGIHRSIKQTRGFWLNDSNIMENNSKLTLDLIRSHNFDEVLVDGEGTGHFVTRDVSLETIWKWLQDTKYPQQGLDIEGITGYFNYMNAEFPNSLDKWSIVVVGRGTGDRLIVSKDVSIKMPTRSRNSELGIPELATDRHLSLDLENYPQGLQNENGKYTRNLMWEKRRQNQPVLILYLLDPINSPDSSATFYSESDAPRPECVAAPVLILPDIELNDDQKKELIAYYRLESLPGSGR